MGLASKTLQRAINTARLRGDSIIKIGFFLKRPFSTFAQVDQPAPSNRPGPKVSVPISQAVKDSKILNVFCEPFPLIWPQEENRFGLVKSIFTTGVNEESPLTLNAKYARDPALVELFYRDKDAEILFTTANKHPMIKKLCRAGDFVRIPFGVMGLRGSDPDHVIEHLDSSMPYKLGCFENFFHSIGFSEWGIRDQIVFLKAENVKDSCAALLSKSVDFVIAPKYHLRLAVKQCDDLRIGAETIDNGAYSAYVKKEQAPVRRWVRSYFTSKEGEFALAFLALKLCSEDTLRPVIHNPSEFQAAAADNWILEKLPGLRSDFTRYPADAAKLLKKIYEPGGECPRFPAFRWEGE
jgi:hypothetical protein